MAHASHYDIGTCYRCGGPIRLGKPDIDYILVPGFGMAKDVLWHMNPCAIAENTDPKSPWKGSLIIERRPDGESGRIARNR